MECLASGLKIIPNSSKTKPEIDAFCAELGAELAVICENGAAIYGIEHLGIKPETTASDSPIIFGKTIENILDIFETAIPLLLRQNCHFIRDLPIPDQEQALGLTGMALSLAMKRNYSLPFLFSGDDNQLAELNEHIEMAGLSCRKGGRVFNLTGQHNKADALAYIRDALQKVQVSPTIICLGDSENDRHMLEAADISCVIPLPDKPAMSVTRPDKAVIIASQQAPQGWKQSLEMALARTEPSILVRMEM